MFLIATAVHTFKRPKNLKPDFQLANKILFICFDVSLLKMMKNAFYFIAKALFVLKMFKFSSWLFGYVEKTVWVGK